MTDTMDDMGDLPEGTDALSSSPGPGDLVALAEHPLTEDSEDNKQPLDEFPMPAEGQPSRVTGLVVGEPDDAA
jgi:hypothetical protein